MDTEFKRYRLDVAYDGTDYHGWQIQPNGDSIQARIECRLRVLVGASQACKLHGSGRTDQGVHARGQTAHVDLATRIPPPALTPAINAGLPADIRVLRTRIVEADFHARRSARAKEYRYFVQTAPVLPPHIARYCLQAPRPLDRTAMQAAADRFCGRHDFRAFSANPNRPVPDAVRVIERFAVAGRGRQFCFQVRGNGFLYKMVRSMVGFLLRVGEGTEAPENVTAILQANGVRTARVPTAPPHGLFLWRVFY